MARFNAGFGWVLAILALAAGCGLGPKKSGSEGGDESLSRFEAEVNPILQESCGGCHSNGAKHTVYVGDEAQVRAKADAIADMITTDKMPPARARRPLTPEEKQKILSFLGK